MATRRMISKAIIDSARFMKMPSTSQNLYFHLIVRADDDGVVEAYNILRTIGASEDDLRILVAKQYVVVLNEDLVTFVSDWLEHNKIRPDRKINSIYQELLVQVVPEAKTVTPRIRMDRRGTSQGQPKVGIGKDRLGQYSVPPNAQQTPLDLNNSGFEEEQEEKCIKWFREHGVTIAETKLRGFFRKHGYAGIMRIYSDWQRDSKSQRIGIGAFVSRLDTLTIKPIPKKAETVVPKSQQDSDQLRSNLYNQVELDFSNLSESDISLLSHKIKRSDQPFLPPRLFYHALRKQGYSHSEIINSL